MEIKKVKTETIYTPGEKAFLQNGGFACQKYSFEKSTNGNE